MFLTFILQILFELLKHPKCQLMLQKKSFMSGHLKCLKRSPVPKNTHAGLCLKAWHC